MNKFKLIVDGHSERHLTIEILKEAIYNLSDDAESYIILEPKVPIHNSIYLQAIRQGNNYITEIRLVFGCANNYKHYSKIMSNPEELFSVFSDYYLRNQLPPIKNWTDETNITNIDNEAEMVKLYKVQSKEILYFEIWLNEDNISLTIHTGSVGKIGITEDVIFDEEGDLPAKIAMKQLVTAQKKIGYNTVKLTELVVQYSYNLEKENIKSVVHTKEQVEDLLNECLGWTGNGHCEDSDAENNVVNLFCYVVDKLIAVETILNTFSEIGIPDNLKIAYADDRTEEYIQLHPNVGLFSIVGN